MESKRGRSERCIRLRKTRWVVVQKPKMKLTLPLNCEDISYADILMVLVDENGLTVPETSRLSFAINTIKLGVVINNCDNLSLFSWHTSYLRRGGNKTTKKAVIMTPKKGSRWTLVWLLYVGIITNIFQCRHRGAFFCSLYSWGFFFFSFFLSSQSLNWARIILY